jgi:putative solute:sodium symporter small subunit
VARPPPTADAGSVGPRSTIEEVYMPDEDRLTPPGASPWTRLLRRTAVLLAIWFLVGPVLGILLVEPLNQMSLGGIPLGFWISQQGSIYVFVVLIFAYAVMGDRADRDAWGTSRPPAAPAGPSNSPPPNSPRPDAPTPDAPTEREV